jgi:hypothetical protein
MMNSYQNKQQADERKSLDFDTFSKIQRSIGNNRALKDVGIPNDIYDFERATNNQFNKSFDKDIFKT